MPRAKRYWRARFATSQSTSRPFSPMGNALRRNSSDSRNNSVSLNRKARRKATLRTLSERYSNYLSQDATAGNTATGLKTVDIKWTQLNRVTISP
jgi:hypothetical protein